jgi:hypothetical protein
LTTDRKKLTPRALRSQLAILVDEMPDWQRRFKVPARPSKLDALAQKLSDRLRVEAGKSRKQRRTAKQVHRDLVVLGYDGPYERVAAFVRAWKTGRQQEQQTSGRGTCVPLVCGAGEAFQFDWSED